MYNCFCRKIYSNAKTKLSTNKSWGDNPGVKGGMTHFAPRQPVSHAISSDTFEPMIQIDLMI